MTINKTGGHSSPTYWFHLYLLNPHYTLQPEICSAPPSGRMNSYLDTQTTTVNNTRIAGAATEYIMLHLNADWVQQEQTLTALQILISPWSEKWKLLKSEKATTAAWLQHMTDVVLWRAAKLVTQLKWWIDGVRQFWFTHYIMCTYIFVYKDRLYG